MHSADSMVILGKISGVFGIKGWVKVHAFTETRLGIVDYSPWQLKVNGQWTTCKVLQGQAQGKSIVAKLENIQDRDQALALVGSEIAVERDSLPRLTEEQYYWSDLVGLDVVNVEGEAFGKVSHLFETGSNDVLVVKGERERLVPWIMGDVIKQVSLDEQYIRVEWDAEF